jgi:hypothetical protein
MAAVGVGWQLEVQDHVSDLEVPLRVRKATGVLTEIGKDLLHQTHEGSGVKALLGCPVQRLLLSVCVEGWLKEIGGAGADHSDEAIQRVGLLGFLKHLEVLRALILVLGPDSLPPSLKACLDVPSGLIAKDYEELKTQLPSESNVLPVLSKRLPLTTQNLWDQEPGQDNSLKLSHLSSLAQHAPSTPVTKQLGNQSIKLYLQVVSQEDFLELSKDGSLV